MSITTPDAEWDVVILDDGDVAESIHKPTATLVLGMLEQRFREHAEQKRQQPMADHYDVHNARFYTPPTAEEMDAFMAQQFGTNQTADDPEGPQDTAAKIIAALTVPFRRDQISQRKIGGRYLDYVEGHEYITRLNEASPAWSFRMTKAETTMLHVTRYDKQRNAYETDLPCLTVYGELTIPGVGTRAGIGVQMIENNAGEDVMKGALTDCLKNCAKYFGLGLHMYSGDAPAAAADAPQRPAQGRPSQQGQQRPPQAAQAPQQTVSDGDYMAGQGEAEPKRTDRQGKALWKISGANRDVLAGWCAEFGVTNDRDLTEAQAAALITKYGGG